MDKLLSATEAAKALGVATATLYERLSRSDAGEFALRGHSVTIEYFQGDRNGQGRIKIEASEIERLKELMRVRPKVRSSRRPPNHVESYPCITVKLGRPGSA